MLVARIIYFRTIRFDRTYFLSFKEVRLDISIYKTQLLGPVSRMLVSMGSCAISNLPIFSRIAFSACY